MDREIRCECGYLARAGADGELVALARTHAHKVHNMDFSDEQLLALSVPSPDHERTGYDAPGAIAFDPGIGIGLTPLDERAVGRRFLSERSRQRSGSNPDAFLVGICQRQAVSTERAALRLDLDLRIEPIGGTVVDQHGQVRDFHGWLQLAAAIEAVRTVGLVGSGDRPKIEPSEDGRAR
jgi:hypothetical protein